ncbi:DUF397 domain-containing protein [Nocardia jejuensis]|uniref:DUF397 domain-containing protein n=1 Tax=Nocardia jejuensis TaxID=328049 RepID=UPI00083512B4|nr:DUF397 domain-containing protein [Nocardia jejuensis]
MSTELSKADWFKSSRSGPNQDCVEAAHLSEGSIGVRDSTLGTRSPVLVFGPAEWDTFTGAVQSGKFDLS